MRNGIANITWYLYRERYCANWRNESCPQNTHGDVRYFIYDEQTRFILAVQLTLPLAGRVDDFHFQVGGSAGRTKKKEPPEEATPKT